MTISVEDLLQSAADGTIGTLLEDPANVSADLAGQARAVFHQATDAGRLDIALAAAIAASTLWLRLGNRPEALVNYVDWQQIEYMRAESSAEYAAARDGLLRAMEMSDDLDDRAQAFKAGAIAADCSFWASDSATSPGEREQWLLQTIRDLIALEPLVSSDQRVGYERYVSLIAATAANAMSTIWSDDGEAEAAALLHGLAAVADRTVPIDFGYQVAGDAGKTARTAGVLAELSDVHGG